MLSITRRLALATLALVLSCSALAGMAKVADGAAWLATVATTAGQHANAYFDRHPNQEAEQQVLEAVEAVQDAAAALEAVARAADAAADGDLAECQAQAMTAYRTLLSLYAKLGIPAATPPAGGAENADAPMPEPFSLPTEDEVKAKIEYREPPPGRHGNSLL